MTVNVTLAVTEQPDSLSPHDLKVWLEDYLAADFKDEKNLERILDTVRSDVLDAQCVENDIQFREAGIEINDGFCLACSKMLDRWPDFCDLHPVAWWISRRTLIDFQCFQARDGRWTKRSPEGLVRAPSYRTLIVRQECHTHQIEAASRRGCKFCAFLIQRLRDCNALDTFRKIEARLSMVKSTLECSLALQNGWIEGHKLLWLNLPGKAENTDMNDPNAWVAFVSDPDLRTRTTTTRDESSIGLLDVTRKWLEECTERHSSCRSSLPQVLPTRLISVQTSAPHLVQTSELGISCRYATLSHSWGQAPCLKLTKANYERFSRAIPYADLGLCFNDAIAITKALAIGYLWIDALCILQDDEKDWEKESGLMYTVYSNSCLNIAAADAANGETAILTKPSSFRDGVEATTPYRAKSSRRQFIGSDLFARHTSDTHLASRAWTLQEKLLPPRTTHIGNRGAFWECRELIATDSLPAGIAERSVRVPLVYHTGKKVDHEQWQWIVGLYSAANLSFGRDKLPALSGVARAHQLESLDQYLAGMWRRHLEIYLCWSLGEEPQKKPPWRAPSWSWASVDGRIKPPTFRESIDRPWYELKSFARVIDAFTTPSSTDTFGQVKEGLLRLSCSHMIAGHICQSELLDSPRHGIETFHRLQRCIFPFSKDYFDEKEEGKNAVVYVLPMAKGRTGRACSHDDRRTWISEQAIVGLVLAPSDTMHGRFSRIGLFELWKDPLNILDGHDPNLFSLFSELMEECGAAELEAICSTKVSTDTDDDKRYIIEIV